MLYREHQAMAEGWLLSSRDDGFYEVQRYDDDPAERFLSDIEAQAWVKAQSTPIHQEAWALHATRSED